MAVTVALAARREVPHPVNEPVLSYAPGTAERAALKLRLDEMAAERLEIPLVIGGRRVKGTATRPTVMPFEHGHVLADWHLAGTRQVRQALAAAREARAAWAAWPWEDRAAVFLRAADLLTTRGRATINAATMLGQAKTVHQSEIDAACELADFWRFNASYATDIYREQPRSVPGAWNQLEYRPLEGFVYAVTPFNFTSIAGNLPTAPVLMGGVALWKPSVNAVLSAHYVLEVLTEAGLPPGVINFIPGDPETVTRHVLGDRDLAGIHFTGSTAVFRELWRGVAGRLAHYRAYPRLVGETGGKDFILVHPSADPDAVAVAIARGGFEYQGQKCSAPSRVYVPRSLWPAVRDRVVAIMDGLAMGDVRDFRNFLSAVIDDRAYAKIGRYLALARRTARLVHGGGRTRRHGYFVAPTIVQVTDPGHRLMREEIFGPVVTAYVYPDRQWAHALDLVDTTSPYALTGAVFARDREAIRAAAAALRHAAGNFYVNDKPTGAVVSQQPFGGARASGTNDKAGSKLNLLRWVSPRAIKETFDPPRNVAYPFMAEP